MQIGPYRTICNNSTHFELDTLFSGLKEATQAYPCPRAPLGVILPMMLIPHTKKGHGEVNAEKNKGE